MRYFTGSLKRLILTLTLAATILIIAVYAYVSYTTTRQQLNTLLRLQLIYNAELVNSTLSHLSLENHQTLAQQFQKRSENLFFQFQKPEKTPRVLDYYLAAKNYTAVQVEDSRNKSLLFKTANAPINPLSPLAFGFHTQKDPNGILWHTFSITDKQQPYTIIVGMDHRFYNQFLLHNFLMGAGPTIALMLLFAALVIFIVTQALNKINKITKQVAHQNPQELGHIKLDAVPQEIQPLVNALNRLFDHVMESIDQIRRFTSDASHELKTPLAALRTQVEVALNEKDPEQQKALLKKLVNSIERCSHIVSQLLILSRLKPEVGLHDVTHVNLVAETELVMADLFFLADSKHVDLDLQAPASPLYVSGNISLLQILIRNLIDNAIRYAPAHSRVTVTLEQTDQAILLHVADQGPGIPDELKERVLERFYRVAGTKQSGSGLGLSIVKQICALHQAELSLHDNHPGLRVTVHFGMI